MKVQRLVFLIGFFSIHLAHGDNPKAEFGAFVDTYFAFDANQPPTRERLFTTSPSRHSEFNLNLAYIEAKIAADKLRGRFAVQTGTSVMANYASEYRDPARTGIQLADILMFAQEAYAGYQVLPGLWVDAGIFLSHIGAESFISKDNWTYTRSLVADFSPYYQAGVRLGWEIDSAWAFQFHLMNGWQRIVETDGDKAIGTQISFKANDKLSFIHNTFIGKETSFRFFQDLIVKYQPAGFWETCLTLDLGLQNSATWWGTSWLNRLRLSRGTYGGARLEYYSDPTGVNVPTGTSNGFQVFGASANLDVSLTPQLLWRNEVRYLQSADAIFSGSSLKSSTVFGVSSLSLSL